LNCWARRGGLCDIVLEKMTSLESEVFAFRPEEGSLKDWKCTEDIFYRILSPSFPLFDSSSSFMSTEWSKYCVPRLLFSNACIELLGLSYPWNFASYCIYTIRELPYEAS